MSIESETGDLLVRVILDGGERMIRLSGSAAMMSGKLLVFLCALMKKGTAKDIALNPNGMCMVTIPEESIKDFAKTAKKYNLRYFIAKDKINEKGFQDICAKAEDAAVISRICEKLGINAIQNVKGSLEKVADFDSAAEVKKQVSVSFDRALNRITENDYSKDTPRFICERLNPDNYIELHSSRDMYKGQEYTKTKYTVYKAGEKVGDYHDGRFEGRDRAYWANKKAEMKAAGEFSDDIVFFDEVQEFNHYRNLYSMESLKEPQSIEQLKDQVEKEISEIKGKHQNPTKASEQKVSEAGAKNMKAEGKGDIHKFIREYKAEHISLKKGRVKELGR